MKFFQRSKSQKSAPEVEPDGSAESAQTAELERRQAPRVSAEECAPGGLQVHVSAPQFEGTWEVHDLSTSGLSLHLDPDDTREFPRDDVRVRFSLPGEPEPFDIGVRVAHDTVLRGLRRIGLSFDAERTDDLGSIQDRILAQFIARYRPLLRRGDPS